MSTHRIAGLNGSLPVLGAWLLLAACAGGGGVVERLNEQSALFVVTEPDLLAFARTDARLSRSARDYIYLGPVEIDERGTRTHYLWVGISSTIDRNHLGSSAWTPDVLYVDLAGTPVEFELHAVEDVLPGLRGMVLYEPAVAIQRALLARTTVDQLRLLSLTGLPSIRAVDANGELREYLLWDNEQPWPGFAARGN